MDRSALTRLFHPRQASQQHLSIEYHKLLKQQLNRAGLSNTFEIVKLSAMHQQRPTTESEVAESEATLQAFDSSAQSQQRQHRQEKQQEQQEQEQTSVELDDQRQRLVPHRQELEKNARLSSSPSQESSWGSMSQQSKSKDANGVQGRPEAKSNSRHDRKGGGGQSHQGGGSAYPQAPPPPSATSLIPGANGKRRMTAVQDLIQAEGKAAKKAKGKKSQEEETAAGMGVAVGRGKGRKLHNMQAGGGAKEKGKGEKGQPFGMGLAEEALLLDHLMKDFDRDGGKRSRSAAEGREGRAFAKKGKEEGHTALRLRRSPSPCVDANPEPVSTDTLREQVEDMTRERGAHASALEEETSEWEWCRKRLLGSKKGSKTGNVQGYCPWWGLFMDTVEVGKRTALDDIRAIHRVSLPPAKGREEIAVDPKRLKKWLQVGKHAEVKWNREWWQAKIKEIKSNRPDAKPESVLVSYVGGSLDDDEWIQVGCKRIRPPTSFFKDTSTRRNRS